MADTKKLIGVCLSQAHTFLKTDFLTAAGIPLCFANPGKDHYEAVFRDEEEEWTYKADRNEDGYLGVWILL